MGSCLTKKNKNKLATYDPTKVQSVECFDEFSISPREELEPMEMSDYRSFVMRQYQRMMRNKVYFRRLRNEENY